MTTPKFPGVEVQLSGQDGNAFAIMGRVCDALRDAQRAGELSLSREELRAELEEYQSESMSGDYDNLLRTAMKWVTVL